MILLLSLLLSGALNAKADTNNDSWQFTLASGIHSFYAPAENLKWDNPGLMISGGINRLLGKRQVFSAGTQLSYVQNKIQGDAASMVLLGQFLPVLFKRLELGIGTGAGYRFSGYPSTSLKWNGNTWEEILSFKGMLQIPVQISAGYRSVNFASLKVTPFAAWQMHALFGYNPDFVPLPESGVLIGFKIQF